MSDYPSDLYDLISDYAPRELVQESLGEQQRYIRRVTGVRVADSEVAEIYPIIAREEKLLDLFITHPDRFETYLRMHSWELLIDTLLLAFRDDFQELIRIQEFTRQLVTQLLSFPARREDIPHLLENCELLLEEGFDEGPSEQFTEVLGWLTELTPLDLRLGKYIAEPIDWIERHLNENADIGLDILTAYWFLKVLDKYWEEFFPA